MPWYSAFTVPVIWQGYFWVWNSWFQDFFYLGSGGGDAGRNFGYYTSTFSECSVFLGYSKKWEEEFFGKANNRHNSRTLIWWTSIIMMKSLHDIMNIVLCPSYCEIYRTEPHCNKSRYSKQNLASPLAHR